MKNVKNKLFLATAIIALAACSDNTYMGENEGGVGPDNMPISFGFDVPSATRASGAAAATALGNHFIVYGEKSETSDGAAPVTDGSTSHQLVFKNYVVKYTGNSAYTTTSNTKDWEYVGLTQSYGTNVVPQAGETQTIKYWDYSASNYVFTAVSAVESEITSGAVTVTKNTNKTDGNKIYDKGYTVALTAGATATKLFFSDRQEITQGIGTNRDAVNAYGGNVTLTFRNATSQIRVGMYEDIPGYAVKIKKFYYQNAASPEFASMSTEVTSNFTANVPNLATGSAATLTVTYYNEGTRKNQPKISVSGSAANYITLTGSGLAADVTLATTAASPTYDNSGTFTTVFPQESNDKNLKLKMDYQLVNSTTGETINVNGATAEIPAEYLQWKPNFKYTYLFKINDNTNGSTGGGVVGLYPITFDAVEIVAEDGKAEYITTVSEPSITTFGVSAGKYVTSGSEYTAGSDIYATIMDGSSVADFTLSTDVNVYHVTTADASNFKITEASVAEAIAGNKNNAMNVDIYTYDGSSTYTKVDDAATLAVGTTYYKADSESRAPGAGGYVQTAAVADVDYVIVKIKYTNINTATSPYFTSEPVEVTTVPGEDGIDITGTHALKLTGVVATTATTAYAIEYIRDEAFTNDGGKVYSFADEAAFIAAGTLYKDAACTQVAYSTDYAAAPGATYYKKIINKPGTKVYKVIRVN